jgi:hypothetical protein
MADNQTCGEFPLTVTHIKTFFNSEHTSQNTLYSLLPIIDTEKEKLGRCLVIIIVITTSTTTTTTTTATASTSTTAIQLTPGDSSTVQYSKLHYIRVLYNTVQYITVQYSRVHTVK